MPNRLIHETSPYLLQHASNPVDWFPWGDEAFQTAKTLNRPIFLSVGYSSCHWCHVMAHESFENPRIASLLNDNFVSIKVDREERPDVDSVYMSATQMLTGQGGWPMSVFLTPERKPFFSGTYFPPDDRPPMPGFPRVLQAVLEAFTNRRDEVDRTSDEVQQALERQFDWDLPKAMLNQAMLTQACERLVKQCDQVHGGFGGAPKFPPSMTLEFLMRRAFKSPGEGLQQPIELTLTKMAQGGIHDQIGGGFHRYSVDAAWLVPHFEKMLYDNALLGRLYTLAYQAFGNAAYRQVAERLFTYVLREMRSPEGGFYSSQDADSEGEEGKFYLWTAAEIEAALDPETAAVAERYYGVTPAGNFEGKTILNLPQAPSDVAGSLGIGVEELETTMTVARDKLYAKRATRIWPGRDEKILTSWNGLMLRALAEAAATFQDETLAEAAIGNAAFLKQSLWQDGRLLHSYRDGIASIDGFLDDYAGLAAALLSLYELTFDPAWFNWSRELADEMIERFWDEDHGSFFDASGSETTLIARPRDAFDSATPSGNALAAETLLRLNLFTADERYHRLAVSVLETFGTLAAEHPSGFGHLLSAVDLELAAAKELALIGDRDDAALHQMLDVVRGSYRPHLVVAMADPHDAAAVNAVPLLQQRPAADGAAAAYICRNHVCDLPLTDPAELAVALSREV